MRTAESATSRISKHFAEGHRLSPLEALGVFGAYRLADIVLKLRKKGRVIVTTLKHDTNGKTYASYREVFVGTKLRMTVGDSELSGIPSGAIVTVVDLISVPGCIAVRYEGDTYWVNPDHVEFV